MQPATTHAAAVIGAEAHLVEVTADVANGLPGTILTGLPDIYLRETRDRVRAAIVNSGETWPQAKITVQLSPATLPKRGCAFDLAIAISILAADRALPLPLPEDKILFLSELGLDGRMRPVAGVLPAVAEAESHGFGTVVVAAANAAEASQVRNVRVVPARALADLTAWLRGGPEPPLDGPGGPGQGEGPRPVPMSPRGDFADIRGQETARAAAEICAAGGHNLSLLGPAGSGKILLAERLTGIMPDLDRDAALEVSAIHSVAGTLPEAGIITQPPFRAPHHTASKVAMIGGGGGIIRPGEASLAHRGVLFLDSAPEFPGDILDCLRQPLVSGEAVIARVNMMARFPARFSLVLAASPCPCSAAGQPPGECSCTPAARRRYLGRLSGPLMDSIDLKVRMAPSGGTDAPAGGESSDAILGRVVAARDRAGHRLEGTPWRLNSEVPSSVLHRFFPLAPGAGVPLERAVSLGTLSAHAASRAFRVAWTLADLAGRDRPRREDCELALAFATGTSP